MILAEAAARIREYAGADPGMRGISDTLEREEAEFGRHMDALAMKRHHFSSHKTLTSRAADGKARKKGM